MEPPKPPTLLQIRRELMELAERIIEAAMRIPAPEDDQLPPAEE